MPVLGREPIAAGLRRPLEYGFRLGTTRRGGDSNSRPYHIARISFVVERVGTLASSATNEHKSAVRYTSIFVTRTRVYICRCPVRVREL